MKDILDEIENRMNQKQLELDGMIKDRDEWKQRCDTAQANFQEVQKELIELRVKWDHLVGTISEEVKGGIRD
jgi:predicted  nucleic acid-binding Zn-ribbon protein